MCEVLNNWWATAFTTGMPENKTVGEVIIAISYKLVMSGYEQEEIIPPIGFINNYYAAIKFNGKDFNETTKCLNRCDEYKDYYTLTIDKLSKLFPINSIEEAGMAVKKSTKAKTGSKKDITIKTGNFLDGCKSPRLKLYIPKIMEQKMTDQEIIDFMHNEGFKEVNKGFIVSARNNLNAGIYKWAPEIKTTLVELEYEKEPVRPKSTKNEKADEPSRPKGKTNKKISDRKNEPTRPTTKKKTDGKATKKTDTKKTGKKK